MRPIYPNTVGSACITVKLMNSNEPHGLGGQPLSDLRQREKNESLDDYLKNINTYLDDINKRLGSFSDEDNAVAFSSDMFRDAASDGHVEAGEAVGKNSAETPFFAEQTTERFSESVSPDPVVGFSVQQGEEYERFFAESAEPHEKTASNWQNAVLYPELYPDLDELRKKTKNKSGGAASETAAKGKSGGADLSASDGKTSRFSFVTTVVNIALYGAWIVAYIICDICRGIMLTNAQGQMTAQGFTDYTLIISSPMFTVLKIILYIMPVILILWMTGVVKADRKHFSPVNRRLLIATSAVDIAVGTVALVDTLVIKLILA